MRISPTQYFENGYQTEPQCNNYTLYFIIIAIVAGVALGLGLASLSKK